MSIDNLLSGLTHIETELNKAQELMQVNALITLVETETNKALLRIEQEVLKRQAKEKPVDSGTEGGIGTAEAKEVTTPKPKVTREVRVLDIVGLKKELETKADVDAYIHRLRSEFMAAIENNQRIKLI